MACKTNLVNQHIGQLSVGPNGPFHESPKSSGAFDITAPWLYTAQFTDLSILRELIKVLKGWYQVPDFQASTIECSIELIHISSLMLDDTDGRRPWRYGRPAAHIVFGAEPTVGSCKSMTIRGVKASEELGNARCMRVLLEDITKRVFTARQNEIQPSSSELAHYSSVEDHIEALEKKSGSITHLINEIMAAASPLPSYETVATESLIDLFARLYAVRDDYANLPTLSPTPEPSLGAKIQSFYMALDEGKYSLLLTHALTILPTHKSQLLQGIIIQRNILGRFLDEDKPIVLEILRGCGSFEFTVGLIRHLQGTIFKTLKGFIADHRNELPLDEAVYLSNHRDGYSSTDPELELWESEQIRTPCSNEGNGNGGTSNKQMRRTMRGGLNGVDTDTFRQLVESLGV